MRVRIWDRKTDYATVLKWWEGHKVPADYVVPTDRLPPSGWVVTDDNGKLLCITWLYYFAHVKAALLGSVVSNPEIDKKVSLEALDLLFLKVATEADKNGAETVVGVTTREGLVRRAAKSGFVKTTKHSIEFQRERGAFHG